MITIRGQLDEDNFDLLSSLDFVLLACGYESRARAFVERLSFGEAKKIALAFDEQRVLAFDENYLVLKSKGFDVVDIEDRDVRDWLVGQLRSAHREGQLEVSLFVDISSQSRARIAAIVEALVILGKEMAVRAFFGYSVAEYADPPSSHVPNVSIGPISPFFAGWARDPDLPVSLVVGLGYEPDRALGAVEHLEPAAVWAMLPHSSQAQYDESLIAANRQLLDQIGYKHILKYEVEDPNATLAMLAALVAHLAREYSVLLLSSGPKVLVLLSLLVACSRRDVSVWRVSAGVNDLPVDRRPTGSHVVVECEVSPSPSEMMAELTAAGQIADMM